MSSSPVTALVDLPLEPGAPASPRVRRRFGTPVRWIVARALDEVPGVLDAAHAASRDGAWCTGWVHYEAAPGVNATLVPGVHVHAREPGRVFAAFAVFAEPLADTNAPSPLPWRSGPWQNDTLPVARLDAPAGPALHDRIQTIRARIREGDVYQVNLTTPLRSTLSGDPDAYFAALTRAQPHGYLFRIAHELDGEPERILSVSPELFFHWKDGSLRAQPMKGTAPRGRTPEADAAADRSLVESDKERAENVMIVDLMRNDLSRIATLGSVRVPRLFERHALPTVWQMTSTVTADVRPGTSLSDVFGALFPCGSVTGAPKRSAMGLIRQLEDEPRGVYCGAVGILQPGGEALFNVPIRTVTLVANGGEPDRWQARCGVGSGITFDSSPGGEAREWRSKLGFLQRAAEPFELLETLRLEDGAWWLLDEHLARLRRTAARFGYDLDEDAVTAALAEVLAANRAGCHRVRLLVDADGRVRTESAMLLPTTSPVRLKLASTPMPDADDFVRFKTTRRAAYAPFAPSAAERAEGIFDTLLHNARGELTETTFGNIALRVDGHWLTPDESCGLLPGVHRQRLLAEGRITEAVLNRNVLDRAEAVAFLNSVRGWLDADLDHLRAQWRVLAGASAS